MPRIAQTYLLLVPPAPNSMLKKLIMALRLYYLDFLRVFASASTAKLDVFGVVLRRALNMLLPVVLVPNSLILGWRFRR